MAQPSRPCVGPGSSAAAPPGKSKERPKAGGGGGKRERRGLGRRRREQGGKVERGQPSTNCEMARMHLFSRAEPRGKSRPAHPEWTGEERGKNRNGLGKAALQEDKPGGEKGASRQTHPSPMEGGFCAPLAPATSPPTGGRRRAACRERREGRGGGPAAAGGRLGDRC